MKNIPNIQLSIKVDIASPSPAKASDLLKFALAQPPAQGFDFAAIRARNRVADAADKAAATIDLEDADYATARAAVEAARWGSNHGDIIQFAELFGL